MTDIHALTLTEMAAKLRNRELGAEEAVSACLDRMDRTEPEVGALLRTERESALERAREMDASGPDPNQSLWGVPVVIKDVLATKDIPTTCGSRMLENFVPFYDAEAVKRLKEAGAVVLAKSNMDEFAMGSSTENSAFGRTRNPWDPERVPGGSSGGSAASTAAGQTPLSLGTDTGGSIRQPAAFCGCVGVKPTYGRVSRFGLVAYGSSLDQPGPFTRSVEDAARVLQVIAGKDERDSTSSPEPVPDYVAALSQRTDLKGIRLGLPKEYWGEGLESDVDSVCREALTRAEELGAELVPVSLPHSRYAIAAYYIIVMAEASSNLARYDGVRYGYRDSAEKELSGMYFSSRSQALGREVQRRIVLGTYVLSAGYYEAYYKKAAQVRRLVREDYQRALQDCDVLLAPAAPGVPFRLGEKVEDPLQMYLTDVFTNPLNLTGMPGMSLPAGLGPETGLPIGLQLFGPAFGEEKLLQVAHILEGALPDLPFPTGLGQS